MRHWIVLHWWKQMSNGEETDHPVKTVALLAFF